MTFIGNNGIYVTEVQRNGRTYYVCTNGVEFLYDKNLGMLIGNDGTEYIIDSKTQRLLCNNGNDAVCFKNSSNKHTAEFLDGTVYIEVEPIHNLLVRGNSYQATRSGKNLIPYPYRETTKTINGVTFTDNGDGAITVNGTATTATNFFFVVKLPIEKTNYYLSGCPAGSMESYRIDALLYKSDETYITKFDIGTGTNLNLVNTEYEYITLKIIIKGGITVSNLVFKPQLEKGSTATAYEPYGVSPSPDYPSEVQSVGDLTTKNLFNTSDFVNFYTPYWTVPTEYGYHDEVGEECLKVYGTVVAAGRGLYYMENRFKENTPYTFSLDCYDVFAYNGVDGNAMRGVSAWFAYTDGTKDSMLIEGLRKDKKWVHHKVTSNANKTVQGIRLSYASGNAYSYLKNIQLEEGSTATKYEPYHKYDIPIMVTGKNLIPYPYYETTKTINGITITDNGDGSISLSGTSTGQVNFYFSQNLQLKKGIAYTLSASGNYSFGGTASFYIYNSTYGPIAYISLNADNSYTFTPKKDIDGINCYIVIPSNRTVSGTLKPQLELGSTATAYEPYYEPITTHIYLDEPLRKVGDYADYIDFENRKVVRNVKELIFDGISESKRFTSFNSNANNRALLRIDDSIANTNYRNMYGFTNYFQYKYTLYSDSQDIIGYVVSNNNAFFKFGSSSIITDIISANEQLANWNAEGNPLKFYYPLATPTEENISLPPLQTFIGTNKNISIDTKIEPSNIETW